MRFLLSLALFTAVACGDDDGFTTTPPADFGPRADSGPGADLGPEADGGPGTDMGPPEGCGEDPAPALAFENLLEVGGFDQPVFATTAPGEPDTIYVVEKPGRIRRVVDGVLQAESFLDFAAGGTGEGESLLTSGEQGLLGLAFHPDYETNGRFFVFFTPGDPRRNVVAEYRRSDENPLLADDDNEVARLVSIDDSESNHNGGMIAFGPDGYLYVGTGDEGGANDAHGEIGNGLDVTNRFGAILRLDVDNAPGFESPGAPVVDGAHPQLWAYGLRNPWRFSFDALTGDLWIGDVGQGALEEVDFLPAGYPGGANFGWRAYEGDRVFDADLTAMVDATDYVPPIVSVPHNSSDAPLRGARSITGGVVYRGSAIPELQGFYVYTDYLSSDVAAFQLCSGEVTQHARLPGLRMGGGGLVSINEDGDGELLLVNLNQGAIFRVVAP